jgi:hypothetical protein
MLTRHVLRLTALSLLAILAATAAAASSAQAADWLVEIAPGIHELIINTNNLPIALEADNKGKLLTTLGLNKIAISCTEEKVTKGLIQEEGKSSGTLEYGGCTTEINGTVAAKCKPTSTIKVPFKAEAFENEKDFFVLVLPATGTVFTTIPLGEACALGEELKVFGSAVVKDCSGFGGLLTLALRHLIELGPSSTGHASALKVANGASESSATLDGSVWVKLENDKRWKLMREGVL